MNDPIPMIALPAELDWTNGLPARVTHVFCTICGEKISAEELPAHWAAAHESPRSAVMENYLVIGARLAFAAEAQFLDGLKCEGLINSREYQELLRHAAHARNQRPVEHGWAKDESESEA